MAGIAKLRKDKKQLIRGMERLDVASGLLHHKRGHLDSLLADEQLAREQAEKENADLLNEITELALRKAMEDVLVRVLQPIFLQHKFLQASTSS